MNQSDGNSEPEDGEGRGRLSSGVPRAHTCWVCLPHIHSPKGPLVPPLGPVVCGGLASPQPLGVSTGPGPGPRQCRFPLATVTGSGGARGPRVRLMRRTPGLCGSLGKRPAFLRRGFEPGHGAVSRLQPERELPQEKGPHSPSRRRHPGLSAREPNSFSGSLSFLKSV